MECQAAAGRDADRPLAAFQDLLSWCAANSSRFYGRHDVDSRGGIRVPINGWAGKWAKDEQWDEMSISVLSAKEVLKNLGHNPHEIVNRWVERNWVMSGLGEKKNRSKPVRIEGVIMRCYCISREAIESCLGD